MKRVLLAIVVFLCSVTSRGSKADTSTAYIDSRASQIVGAFRNYDVHINETPEATGARHGAQAAAARLRARGGNDPAMIDYITHFYDGQPVGKEGYWTTISGVAWILVKYWDKFSPDQREHLKTQIKKQNNFNHGTENHAINKQVGMYLYAQLWPNEPGGWQVTDPIGRSFRTVSSVELMRLTKTNLLNTMRSLFVKGLAEDLSTTYIAVHLYPYYVLYDCAVDSEMRDAANAALNFHVGHLAANSFDGMVIPPFRRENFPSRNTHSAGFRPVPATYWYHWLYWSESQNRTPHFPDFISDKESRYVIHAALSGWRPSPVINAVAAGKTVPLELTSSFSNFGFYGTGTPGAGSRYVYRDRYFAMGSGNLRFLPALQLDEKPFGLFYESSDAYNFIDLLHSYWHSNNNIWRGASPFMQVAQRRGSAISLFNVPTTDPWAGYEGRGGNYDTYFSWRSGYTGNLRKEALLRFPKTIDEGPIQGGVQQTRGVSNLQSGRWIFLREGDVYIGVYPVSQSPTIQVVDLWKESTLLPSNHKENYLNQFTFASVNFWALKSQGPQSGFVIEVSSKAEATSFVNFQRVVSSRPVNVDWNSLALEYTNFRGERLRAVWSPPQYNPSPPVKSVLVRPRFWVNGQEVLEDADFRLGRAVIKSPTISLQGQVLSIAAEGKRQVIDWRGPRPIFSGF
jgi:hypothetical protein